MTIEWKIAIAVVLILVLAYLIRRILATKRQMRRIQQVQQKRIRDQRET